MTMITPYLKRTVQIVIIYELESFNCCKISIPVMSSTPVPNILARVLMDKTEIVYIIMSLDKITWG